MDTEYDIAKIYQLYLHTFMNRTNFNIWTNLSRQAQSDYKSKQTSPLEWCWSVNVHKLEFNNSLIGSLKRVHGQIIINRNATSLIINVTFKIQQLW